jgi:hypothetical protein
VLARSETFVEYAVTEEGWKRVYSENELHSLRNNPSPSRRSNRVANRTSSERPGRGNMVLVFKYGVLSRETGTGSGKMWLVVAFTVSGPSSGRRLAVVFNNVEQEPSTNILNAETIPLLLNPDPPIAF